MKTTESGYEVMIRVFVPADPRQPETIETAMSVILSLNDDRILDLGQSGETRVEIGAPRWIARRKRDVDSITGTADDQGICKLIPASGVPQPPQEGAGAVSTPEAAPAAVLGNVHLAEGSAFRNLVADDEMPPIPENLRRVPR